MKKYILKRIDSLQEIEVQYEQEYDKKYKFVPAKSKSFLGFKYPLIDCIKSNALSYVYFFDNSTSYVTVNQLKEYDKFKVVDDKLYIRPHIIINTEKGKKYLYFQTDEVMFEFMDMMFKDYPKQNLYELIIIRNNIKFIKLY